LICQSLVNKTAHNNNTLQNHLKETKMKKVIIAVIAIVAFTATTAIAKDSSNKVNFRVANHFKAIFTNATNVEWDITTEYTRATFIADGEKKEAYYNADAELIGQSRSITLDEFSKTTQKEIAKKYAGYTVKEAIEFSNEDFVDYYVSLENAKEKLILKISREGECSVFKTTEK
jgi:uncharacterized protein YxeA